MKKYKIIAAFITVAVLCSVFFLEGKAPEKASSFKTSEKKESVFVKKEPKKAEKTESEVAATATTQDNSISAESISEAPPSQPNEAAPSITSEKEAPTAVATSAEAHTVNEQNPTASPASSAESAEQCLLSVHCDTILKNLKKLTPEKEAFVPDNGIIYESRSVHFEKGESVFDVLQREMKKNKIHFEFVDTPIYGSAYIEGIGNLYEFDCGERSGWMYRVNGVFPNYGCSSYQLKDGDIVEWLYTCDLGADIGGDKAATGEKNE